MKKIEEIFQKKIFIFDFSFICVLLGFILYISYQNIFSKIDLKRTKKNIFIYKKFKYPINIKNIKNSYNLIEKKFRYFFNFVKEKKKVLSYLPLKTLIYVPKKNEEDKVSKKKREDEKRKMQKVLRKKNKIIYLFKVDYLQFPKS